jgi:hypothetical protein
MKLTLGKHKLNGVPKAVASIANASTDRQRELENFNSR